MSFHRTPIKYGSAVVDEFIPSTLTDVHVLEAEDFTPDFTDFEEKLADVLESPIGTPPLSALVSQLYTSGKQVTIIVDDNTRPNIHTKMILPPLTRRLVELGVKKEDIKIMIASGSHVPPNEDALENKVLGPEIYAEWKDNVLIHDCDSGNRYMAKTSLGTPIYIDERVLDSCLVIVLSDSEYHYFAGQAGTVKLFCPGVAGRETIRINHPRMFDLERGFLPTCRLGNTKGNPVIEDMIEITEMMKEHLTIFCVDTIVDHGEVVYVQAGDVIECHKAASEPLHRLRVVEVDEPADIVFVSVGELGINLYQAGKGIHAAWNAVRHDKRGWIVLLAPCEDGIGSAAYEEAMVATKDMSVKDALRYVIQTYCTEKTFKIGNQKPPDLFRILLDVEERNIKVVTQLDPDVLSEVYRMEGLNPSDPSEVQSLLRGLVERYIKENPDIPNPRIYVLPDAGLLIKVAHQKE
ncbi:MAG: lactate racemase domain-containing protein [Candidatus Thorarchaeota archaeon]